MTLSFKKHLYKKCLWKIRLLFIVNTNQKRPRFHLIANSFILNRTIYALHDMIGKQDRFTNWLVNSANFPADKQTWTNQYAGNDKFLTAHIPKCRFWNGEPSDYMWRGDKYLSNSVVCYLVELKNAFFSKIKFIKSFTVRQQILSYLSIMPCWA